MGTLHDMGKGGIGLNTGVPVQIDPRFTQTLQRLLSQAKRFQRFIRYHQHIGVTNVGDALT